VSNKIFIKNIKKNTTDEEGRRHFYRDDIKVVRRFNIASDEFYRAGRTNYRGEFIGYTAGGFYRQGDLAVTTDEASWASESTESPYSDTLMWLDPLPTSKWTDASGGAGSATPSLSGMTLHSELMGDGAIKSVASWKKDLDLWIGYNCPTWPIPGGGYVQLRLLAPGGEYAYLFVASAAVGWRIDNLGLYATNTIATSPPQVGKIRIKRVAENWYFYYYDASNPSADSDGWVLIHNSTGDFWDWNLSVEIKLVSPDVLGTNVYIYNFDEWNTNRGSDIGVPDKGTIVFDTHDVVILDNTEQVWMRSVGDMLNGYMRSIIHPGPGNYTPTVAAWNSGTLMLGAIYDATETGFITFLDFINDEIVFWGVTENNPAGAVVRRVYDGTIGTRNYHIDWSTIGSVPTEFGRCAILDFLISRRSGPYERSMNIFVCRDRIIFNPKDTTNYYTAMVQTGAEQIVWAAIAGQKLYVLESTAGVAPYSIYAYYDVNDITTNETVKGGNANVIYTQNEIQALTNIDLSTSTWYHITATEDTSSHESSTLFVSTSEGVIMLDLDETIEESTEKTNLDVEIISAKNIESGNSILEGRVERVKRTIPVNMAGKLYGQELYILTTE